MTKKSTKPNLPQDLLDRARREMGQSSPVEPVAAPEDGQKKPAAPRRVFVTGADLHTQYAYVLLDLRNMATLAAALAAVLIVLSFVI
jgi:hypothetical protein